MPKRKIQKIESPESNVRPPRGRLPRLAVLPLLAIAPLTACGDTYSAKKHDSISIESDRDFSSGEDQIDTAPTLSVLDTQKIIDPIEIHELSPPERISNTEFKIAVFGDSIVNGYKVCGGGEAWPKITQDILNSSGDHSQNVVISNLSVPGETIISPTPENWHDQEGNNLGGSVINRVVEQIPPNIKKEDLPDMVIIVPSINEFILSGKPTDDEKVQYALDALSFINNYLRGIGVQKVLFTQMLRPSNGWSAPQNIEEIQNLITLFNAKLNQVFNVNTLEGNNLDFDNPIGSDSQYFVINPDTACLADGLHPNSDGQSVIGKEVARHIDD
ncbi:SGNH/GDSL hydrolase family protein [Candidatus Saccharibacteria bacterium]|nr:SGNH/GDSL hydrolase family protein [Candidatus Saccharibacteria bacterium]